MGVPSFYRWLSEKYPKIVIDAIEHNISVDGTILPPNNADPNPNGQEFDNLYLDMNGIIHPCSHPEDQPAPETTEEVLKLMFAYIDRIFSIVRPRKVLFMAIDGVAPRAKMNQQRSRRFRAALEAKQKQEKMDDLAQSLPWAAEDEKKKSVFDSNVITPGTPFMHRIAEGLRYYISHRQTSDPGWHNIKVILSDANQPGEGEHKIMDFIRRQRIQPDYDPQTFHVLYGLDADLIMLSLATHEPHFAILREYVNAGRKISCNLCGQDGHYADQCQGKKKEKEGEDDATPSTAMTPYQFLYISTLREYLANDLKTNVPFGKYEVERVIDDWVFLCFFVGNDFLPHLPTLSIREGAIDLLMDLYRKTIPQLSDYLTHNGEVNLEAVELIMNQVGDLEDSILRTRRFKEQRARQNQKRRENRMRQLEQPSVYSSSTPEDFDGPISSRENAKRIKLSLHGTGGDRQLPELTALGKEEETIIRATGGPSPAPSPISSPAASPITPRGGGRSDEIKDIKDDIRLGEEGWKERYYNVKFGAEFVNNDAFRRQLAIDYVEGLVWVMKYYYQGCVSWTWYFPHHYAPFSSDLVNLQHLKFNFRRGKPFAPFEQLMGVLPASSAHALPDCCRQLMSDPDSPIIDFYPEDFEIDLDGCRFLWQGVVKLPFIDETRLLEAVKTIEPQFTAEERLRNSLGKDLLFIRKSNPIYLVLKQQSNIFKPENPVVTLGSLPLPKGFNLFGTIQDSPFGASKSEVLECDIPALPPISKNLSFCFYYDFPEVEESYIWEAKLHPRVILPPRRLPDGECTKPRPYFHGNTIRGESGGYERPPRRFNDNNNNDRRNGNDDQEHKQRGYHPYSQGQNNNRRQNDRYNNDNSDNRNNNNRNQNYRNDRNDRGGNDRGGNDRRNFRDRNDDSGGGKHYDRQPRNQDGRQGRNGGPPNEQRNNTNFHQPAAHGYAAQQPTGYSPAPFAAYRPPNAVPVPYSAFPPPAPPAANANFHAALPNFQNYNQPPVPYQNYQNTQQAYTIQLLAQLLAQQQQQKPS